MTGMRVVSVWSPIAPAALLVVVTLAGGCASTPDDKDPVQLKLNDLDARVARLEQISVNQAEMSQRLDELQASMRELRGRIDELEHSEQTLSKQQRDFYGDLDKRLT